MSERIRILTIGHSYVVALNRAIAREVARDTEFDVTVASPASFEGDLRHLRIEPEPEGSPLRVVPIETRGSRITHAFCYRSADLKRLIRDGGFDVVHAWEEPYIYAGYQIARCLDGLPTRFCFRTAQSYSKYYPPPFRQFERATLARAQGWIAGGHLVYQAMRSRGYPAETGRILTLAVDTGAFVPADDALRRSSRQRLGLRAPVIGFVGRLTRAKGLSILLRALDRLGDERPWNLLLLGAGAMEREILRWSARRGWSARVHLRLVRHDEVPAYLAAMDLLVAPSQTTRSWREQFGRMLIEAFACGVPVIGSDSGEIPYVVGDAGRIVAEGNVDGWTTTIGELLDSPSLRAELAGRGLVRCRTYSSASVAAQYRAYYRWLAARPTSPRPLAP